MKLAKELRMLRKKNNLNIELVSKTCEVEINDIKAWESGKRVPSDDKLKILAKLYSANEAELIKISRQRFYDEYRSKKDSSFCEPWGNVFHFEYTSKTQIKGLPLVHINIGAGKFSAKGIVAIGTFAQGVLAIGLISIGLVSLGILSIGALAIGLIALGLMAIGGVSIGLMSIGILSIGLMSIGILSVGLKSSGVIVAGSLASKIKIGKKLY